MASAAWNEGASVADGHAFRAGMRRLASGIALVTAEHAGVGHGLAATSVTALTADPPTLLVCVNKAASSHDAIAAAGRFCINILSADHADLLQAFAGSAGRGERFAGADWRRDSPRPPRLATALVAFDCRVARRIEHGTHTIYIGAVDDVVLGSRGDALVYFDGVAQRLAR